MNAYAHEKALERGEEPPPADDKTFITPDGWTGDSPWWYAGYNKPGRKTPGGARRVLNQIGVMDRRGKYIPYKPSGRPRGSADRAPRQRWHAAPARDTAPLVLAAYRELTQREQDPLTDRQARAELCRQFRLNRVQVSRRLVAAEAAEAAAGNAKPAAKTEPDNSALASRYLELLAVMRAAGYSERGAADRARAALSTETGLGRRELAARITAAQKAHADRRAAEFAADDAGEYYQRLRARGFDDDTARRRMVEQYQVTREQVDARLDAGETVRPGQ
jgi:hypothetical protein